MKKKERITVLCRRNPLLTRMVEKRRGKENSLLAAPLAIRCLDSFWGSQQCTSDLLSLFSLCFPGPVFSVFLLSTNVPSMNFSLLSNPPFLVTWLEHSWSSRCFWSSLYPLCTGNTFGQKSGGQWYQWRCIQIYLPKCASQWVARDGCSVL